MNLTGTWEGIYRYGENYGDVAGDAVGFTMSLTLSSSGRSLRGYVRDADDELGTPDRGRVSGKYRGHLLEFVKSLPIGYVHHEDGTTSPTTEILAEQLGLEIVDTSPHRIRYLGHLSDSGQTMSGTWEILAFVVKTTDGSYRIPGRGEGTWEATRISPKPSRV